MRGVRSMRPLPSEYPLWRCPACPVLIPGEGAGRTGSDPGAREGTRGTSITDNIPALIAEARAWTREDADAAPRNLRRLALVLADALEAAEEGWDADVRRLAKAHNQRLAVEAERDHYRDLARRGELQCQDAEKDAARYRAALVEALAEEERCTESGTRMWRILTRALNEKEDE